jgi:hypothetical protein
VTYRSAVQGRRGRRELSVMCSSPGDARSWCAQAVESVNSCPMCGIVLLECEYRVCDAARLRWEVEGVGRGERSKTLLPPGRSWALRAVLGTVHADAERQQLWRMAGRLCAENGGRRA